MRLFIAAVLALLLSGIYTLPTSEGAALAGLGLYRDVILKVLFGWMVFEALLGLRDGAASRGHYIRIASGAIVGTVCLAMTAPDAKPLFGWSTAEGQAYRLVSLILLSLWILIESFGAMRSNKSAAVPKPVDVHQEKPFKPAVKEELPPFGEVLVLLSLLQEKGRFLDFLGEDITKFNDSQVAAASRVVHQGCVSIVREYFDIQPAHDGKEGQTVTIDKGIDPSSYRLIGKVAGEAPYVGKLIHRGWKTRKITLPRSVKVVDPLATNIISPTELELK